MKFVFRAVRAYAALRDSVHTINNKHDDLSFNFSRLHQNNYLHPFYRVSSHLVSEGVPVYSDVNGSTYCQGLGVLGPLQLQPKCQSINPHTVKV